MHFSMALDGEILACDLGQDAVFRYGNENGKLIERGRIAFPAGSGPRHLAASPLLRDRLYCVAELSSQVFALTRTPEGWRIDQALSLLPHGFTGENTAAAFIAASGASSAACAAFSFASLERVISS